MTPQIKQRIEQIRRGEVPEGYKRTKVGIVPEEWKIKRLAQVLRKQTCKNTNNAIHNVLTNSATRGIVDQKDYFDKQIANSENTDNYYIVENGYFVYNPRISVSAPCGPFNKYYGCEKGIMSPLYTVYKYIDCSTDYTEYLSYFFSSANWHRYMNGIANYGARNDRMNVTSDTMSAMPLPYPPLPEQKKIAEILQTQDKLIELQQKKIEELKKLKKAYLSKMFPKKGCNVPEIRFPGFTDPWEQRKLGDLLQTLPFKQFLKEPEPDGKYEIIQQGNEPVIGFANGTPCGDYKDVVIFGDHTLSLYKPQHPFFVATDGVRIVKGQQDTDGYYLLSLLERYKPQSEGYKRYYCILADTNCITTYNTSEQGQIGAFFKHLDHLTTLHQRKLEEMKIYKKSLMQLLLTGIVRM